MNTYRSAIWSISLVAMMSAVAPAQTVLRWDLKPGEKFTVDMVQETDSAVAYAGKSAATQINLKMRLGWDVKSNDAGKMQIQQSVTHIAISLDSQTAGRIEYDSASEARPAGRARELAAAVAPLLKATVAMTMNQRGEVLSATFTGEAVEKLMLAGEGGAATATKEKIDRLLRQALLVLPEGPVKADDTWTNEAELATALGQARQTTTYRYVGPVAENGEQLEKIQSEAKLVVSGKNEKKIVLKKHEQKAEFWFSPAAGRLIRAVQKETLVTERPYRETTIEVTLNSTQTTTIAAVEEK